MLINQEYSVDFLISKIGPYVELNPVTGNKWVEFKLETKTVDLPKSIVDELPDGRLVAPFWALKVKIAMGGRDSLVPVRKVQFSGLSALLLDATPLAAMMKKN